MAKKAKQQPGIQSVEVAGKILRALIDGGRPLRILDQILEQYKVVQHGVSMYFGSAEKPNREHLRRLKELVKRTKSPWLSISTVTFFGPE